MKPIIPWNAVEFFSNPGKYIMVDRDGEEANVLPSLALDGTLAVPVYWKGMREKTVITKHVKYVRMYHDGNRKTFAGSMMFDTKKEAELSTSSAFLCAGTLTWEEES